MLSLPVSTGTFIDRYWITHIKAGRLVGDGRVFALRRLAELDQIAGGIDNLLQLDDVRQLSLQLRETNERLWQAEDEVREAAAQLAGIDLSGAFQATAAQLKDLVKSDFGIARIARYMQATQAIRVLNKRRQDLVEELDRATNQQSEPKLYAQEAK